MESVVIRHWAVGVLNLALVWSCSGDGGRDGATQSVGGGGGVGGGTGAVGGSRFPPECFVGASCTDGVVSVKGSSCGTSELTCELGCRIDFEPPNSINTSGYGNPGSDWARSWCEEFRRERGPRWPGDPCTTDFDCLPFPSTALGVIQLSPDAMATAWPGVLTCANGMCAEGAVVHDDYGGDCASSPTLSESESCESGLCFDSQCTMSCRADDDCPVGGSCQFVSVAGRRGRNGVCVGGDLSGTGGEGGAAGAAAEGDAGGQR